MQDWYVLQNPSVRWIVDGLFPADGHSAIVGKPKAGKSTLIRNLVASVIKSRPFLDRPVNVPQGTGKVLYIHLDRKDRPARVAAELKELEITDDEAPRLHFIVAEDLPADIDSRLQWLKEEIEEFKPNLLVIDLMLQFLDVQNSNDYNQVLKAINHLQDVLSEAHFEGALVAAFHSRKAVNPDCPADDVLGSTAIRGSFGTLILLSQNRKEKLYSIVSDQTDREQPWGEIDSTEIVRNSDGTMALGRSLYDLQKAEKAAKTVGDLRRLLSLLNDHPDSSMKDLIEALAISKPRLLALMERGGDLIASTGEGKKGRPKLYSLKSGAELSACGIGAMNEETEKFLNAFGS
jgi:hypothetical protein